MTRIELAHSRLPTQGDGDRSSFLVAGRVVSERPLERCTGLESAQARSTGLRVLDRGEAARSAPSGPPLARAVLDVGIVNVPTAVQPQRDGVRRPPFIDRAGVEESEEHVEPALIAQDSTRCAEWAVKCLRLD